MQMMQKFPLPKKKMMKKYANKFMAATMAAAMMVSMGGMNVLAADTKSTDVKYSVTEGYTWSVPSEIDFTANDTVTANAENGKQQKVMVTKNVIGVGKKLQITAKGSGANDAFSIVSKNDSASTNKEKVLNYSIKVESASTGLAVGETILELNAGTDTGSKALTFTLTKDSVEQAGDYNGTVTYTAAVVNQ